jgi:16S rRNA (cytosine1402-N4)-methyltransferase
MRSLSTVPVEELSSALFPEWCFRFVGTPSSVEGLQMAPTFNHRSVQLAEVVDLFAPVPAGVIVDCTLGGAGHAVALLQSRPDLSIIGLDRDVVALTAASERLAEFGARASVISTTFDALGDVIDNGKAGSGPWPVDGDGSPLPLVGVLFDLGVSSPQLDDPDRGFSYRADAPLDMRMDQRTGQTAADLVNSIDRDALTELLRENGEDRLARRIATAIVAARPLSTTGELAEVVSRAVPAAVRRRGHPAKRTFQALRIAVNAELDQLEIALDAAIRGLVPGGRVVVLSYHSGEDRLVKRAFQAALTGGCACPTQLPCVCGAVPLVAKLHGGSIGATDEEIATNPRAESVRLRAVVKVKEGQTS